MLMCGGLLKWKNQQEKGAKLVLPLTEAIDRLIPKLTGMPLSSSLKLRPKHRTTLPHLYHLNLIPICLFYSSICRWFFYFFLLFPKLALALPDASILRFSANGFWWHSQKLVVLFNYASRASCPKDSLSALFSPPMHFCGKHESLFFHSHRPRQSRLPCPETTLSLRHLHIRSFLIFPFLSFRLK